MKKTVIFFLGFSFLLPLYSNAQRVIDVIADGNVESVGGRYPALVEETYLPLKKYPEFKMVKKNLYLYLYYWAEAQFKGYLEFPKDVEKAFSFHGTEGDMLPYNLKKFLWDNRLSFHFETTDSTLFISYKNKAFARFTADFRCDDISNFIYYMNYFRVYDTRGMLVCFDDNDSVRRVFWRAFYDSASFKKDTCLKSLTPSSEDNGRFVYPFIRILYQYDSSGLQIHDRCSGCYKMERNVYTDALEKTAKDFCEKNSFFKLVFVTYYMECNKSFKCNCEKDVSEKK